MPAKLYILAGPAGAFDRAGYFRDDRVPSGKFAVAYDTTDGPWALGVYDTREEAEAKLQWRERWIARIAAEHAAMLKAACYNDHWTCRCQKCQWQREAHVRLTVPCYPTP